MGGRSVGRPARTSPPSRQAQRALGDARDDRIEIREDVLLRNPQHVPPELVERAVPRAVMPRAALMGRPVDLDDERHLGARESRRCAPR
jgi:hypothetical protein